MTYFEIFDKHFPKELAEKAKKNTINNRQCYANFVGDTTFYSGVLAKAFAWDESSQGFNFWDEVNHRYDRVPV